MAGSGPGLIRALFLGLVVFLVGCQAPVEEMVDTSVKSSRSVAEGSIEKSLVGNWLAKDKSGEFKMKIEESGAYSIDSKVQTRGGLMNSKVDGKWATKADELLMERKGPDGSPFTVIYRWSLSKDALELKSDGSKTKYRYLRQ